MTKKSPVWKKNILANSIAVVGCSLAVSANAGLAPPSLPTDGLDACGSSIAAQSSACKVDAAAQSVTVTSAGSINNNSSLVGGQGGIVITSTASDAVIVNDGEILSHEIDGVSGATSIGVQYFANSPTPFNGSITNNASIKAKAISESNANAQAILIQGHLGETAGIVNSGLLQADTIGSFANSQGIAINGYSYGDITNAGTINVDSQGQMYSNSVGIVSGEVSKTISNTGTINSTSTSLQSNAGAVGIASYGSLSGAISNGGTITSEAKVVGKRDEGLVFASAQGLVVDSDISETGTIVNSGALNVRAEVDYSKGASSDGGQAEAIGIYAAASSSSSSSSSSSGFRARSASDVLLGSLSNSGTISVEVVNKGNAVNSEAFGIYAGEVGSSSVASASIENTGPISIKIDSVNDNFSSSGLRKGPPAGSVVSAGFGIKTASVYGSVSNSNDISVDVDVKNNAEDFYSSVGIVQGGPGGPGGPPVRPGDLAARPGRSSPVIAGISTDQIAEGGRLNNSGTINVDVDVSNAGEGFGGFLVTSNVYGIRADGVALNAELNNSGSITQNINLSNEGAGHDSSGPDPMIEGSGIFGLSSGYINGAVTNSGNISLNVNASNNQRDSGFRRVEVGGVIGLYADGLNTNAKLQNSGSISVDASVNNSGVNNSDLELRASASGMVIDGSVNQDGEFTNSGQISVSSSVSDASSKAHAARAYAVGLGAFSGVDGAVNSSGSINVNAEARDLASAAGFVVDRVDSNGSVSNSGSITVAAQADEASAIGMGVGTSVAGSFDNSGSIDVVAKGTASTRSVYGVRAGTLESGKTFINTGSISAVAAGRFTEAYAVRVDNAQDDQAGVVNETGASIHGAVHVGGSGTFTNKGKHTMSVGQTNFSRTFAAGDVDYTGGQFDIQVNPGEKLEDGDVFTDLVKSGGTLTAGDAFTTLADNRLLYDFSAKVNDDNGVDVTVSRQALNEVLVGGSYSDISGILETLLTSDNPPAGLSGLLAEVNEAKDLNDMRTIIGKNLSPLAGGQSAVITKDLLNRITDVLNQRSGDTGQGSGDLMAGRDAWAKLIINDGELDTSKNVAGYEVSSQSLVIGIDKERKPGVRAGVALAYTQGEVDSDLSSGDFDVTAYQLTAYGKVDMNDTDFLQLQAGYGQTENAEDGGSTVEGSSVNVYAGYGRRIEQSDKLTFTPSANAAFARVSEDAYTRGFASVKANDYDSLVLGVDGQAAYAINKGSKDMTLTSHLGLGYEVLGDETDVKSSFTLANQDFTTKADVEALAVTAGVGINVEHSETVEYSFNYDLTNRGDFTNNALSAKLKVKF